MYLLQYSRMPQNTFYVIGNWKSNKTVEEAIVWGKEFVSLWKKNPFPMNGVQVILCPAYIHLVPLAALIKEANLPLKLGVQDISPYPSGTYTGAVCATMVRDLVEFVIIGHSERRTHFHENGDELLAKIEQAQKIGLFTIYCIQNEQMQIPQGVNIVAYEPVWAISQGDPYATAPEDPAIVAQKIATIKNKSTQQITVLYGGSTTPENVFAYKKQAQIGGVLPGGASLKPDTFYRLLANAAT